MSGHADLHLMPLTVRKHVIKLLTLAWLFALTVSVSDPLWTTCAHAQTEAAIAEVEVQSQSTRESSPKRRTHITERDLLGRSDKPENTESYDTGTIGHDKPLAPPKLRSARLVTEPSTLEEEGKRKNTTVVLTFALLALTTLSAVLLGIAQRAVFFMDAEDVILTCLTWGAPLLGLLACALFDLSNSIVPFLTILPFGVLFLLTFVRSIRFNRGLLVGIIMATGKLMFVPLVVLPLLGGGSSDKRRSKTRSLLPLVMVSLLLVALVNGEKVAKKRASDGDSGEEETDSTRKAKGHRESKTEQSSSTGAKDDRTDKANDDHTHTDSKRTTSENAQSGSRASSSKQGTQGAQSNRSNTRYLG